MREIYKNPILYYLLVPVLVAIWPLLVWQVYLPQARQAQQAEYDLFLEGQSCIMEILQYDPDRLNLADAPEVTAEFTWGRAVDRVGNLCAIPASNCRFTAGNIIEAGKKKRQEARITLTDVGIIQAAKFLSTMQSTWVNVTCEKAKLTKRKGMPDQWEVDFTFWYYH